MRFLLIGVAAAATVALSGALSAQVAPPPQQWAYAGYPAPYQAQVPPPQPWPAAAYPVVRYPFPAVTPEQAYNDGLINRWELERYEGPTPQALMGPNPSGGKGSQGDRGM